MMKTDRLIRESCGNLWRIKYLSGAVTLTGNIQRPLTSSPTPTSCSQTHVGTRCGTRKNTHSRCCNDSRILLMKQWRNQKTKACKIFIWLNLSHTHGWPGQTFKPSSNLMIISGKWSTVIIICRWQNSCTHTQPKVNSVLHALAIGQSVITSSWRPAPIFALKNRRRQGND